MKKILLTTLLVSSLAFSNEIIDKENLFTIKLQNKDFGNIYAKIKDEISFQSFVIVKELNLANATNNVAKSLDKKPILENGKNLLICKPAFAYEMFEENISNITYCPLAISVYEQDKNIYISYRKYKALEKGNSINKVINEDLKNLILESVEE